MTRWATFPFAGSALCSHRDKEENVEFRKFFCFIFDLRLFDRSWLWCPLLMKEKLLRHSKRRKIMLNFSMKRLIVKKVLRDESRSLVNSCFHWEQDETAIFDLRYFLWRSFPWIWFRIPSPTERERKRFSSRRKQFLFLCLSNLFALFSSDLSFIVHIALISD